MTSVRVVDSAAYTLRDASLRASTRTLTGKQATLLASRRERLNIGLKPCPQVARKELKYSS
ncbi:hypothetical protein ANSO36C_22790 [Nostoc cf. commune SO-36]|uniref:Uncharacterized protein n=1 Tax=Nostoc cf. commune SO-36 TaxID=449208 RepID=A0ABN6Q509_NOSCO|nr:hypothetical protein [Nostoc commune]BDI16477.1 hypothetical protein ANSO36C_22790 [Nostoc cf. commune SO-36]